MKVKPEVDLRGELIQLHPHRRRDVPTYHRSMCDVEVNALTLVDPTPRPVAKTRQLIQRWMDDANTFSFAIHTLAEKRLIGWCTLVEFGLVDRTADFSIRIAEKDYWGRGYGTDAATVLIRFGFEELKLQKVVLNVFSFNERAQACYQKVGFKTDSVLKGQFYRDDRRWDNIEMSITPEEFAAACDARAACR